MHDTGNEHETACMCGTEKLASREGRTNRKCLQLCFPCRFIEHSGFIVLIECFLVKVLPRLEWLRQNTVKKAGFECKCLNRLTSKMFLLQLAVLFLISISCLHRPAAKLTICNCMKCLQASAWKSMDMVLRNLNGDANGFHCVSVSILLSWVSIDEGLTVEMSSWGH